MRYSEQFMEHIEYAFAVFCKIVLRNAAISPYCVTKSMKKAGKKRFVSHSPFSAPCMAVPFLTIIIK